MGKATVNYVTEGEGDDVAAYCDACHAPLKFGPTGIMRPTGEFSDGVPVVTILCFPCAERSKPDAE